MKLSYFISLLILVVGLAIIVKSLGWWKKLRPSRETLKESKLLESDGNLSDNVWFTVGRPSLLQNRFTFDSSFKRGILMLDQRHSTLKLLEGGKTIFLTQLSEVKVQRALSLNGFNLAINDQDYLVSFASPEGGAIENTFGFKQRKWKKIFKNSVSPKLSES